MKYTALYCREDSAYKQRPNWDVWDKQRDARNYAGTNPVVCHPPCRAWSSCRGLAFNTSDNPEYEKAVEMQLALHAMSLVRSVGGILEHPKSSGIWTFFKPTIYINQVDFGHVANKPTALYIYPKVELPLFPMPSEPTHKMFVRKAGDLSECSQYHREYTPEGLIDWFELILDRIKEIR